MAAIVNPLNAIPHVVRVPEQIPAREAKPILAALEALKNSAPLRKIKTDLGELQRVLKLHDNLKDETSKAIREWHTNFTLALRVDKDLPKLIDQFIPLLQEILIDPIPRLSDPNSPNILDDPRLGSDGKIYSFKTLAVFMSTLDIDSNRSPLTQDDPAPFAISTIPHPIAAYAVEWLKKSGRHVTDLQNDARFKELVIEGKAVKIPADAELEENFDEIERQILAEQAARIDRQNRIRQQAKAETGSLRQKLKKRIVETHNPAKEIADRIEHTIANNKKADSAAIADITRRSRELETRIGHLEQDFKGNTKKVQEAKGQLDQSREQIKGLDSSIAEVKEAIKNREGSSMGGAANAVVQIAICAAASYAASQTLSYPIKITPIL